MTTHLVRLSNGREFGPVSLSTIEQWTSQGRVPADALLVTKGDAAAQDDCVRSVLSEPSLRAILQAPPAVSTAQIQPPATQAGGAMSGIIPYKNAPALVGYYLAVASLIPFIGFFLGIIAFILGIIGRQKRLHDPHARGLAHAWIAIILGGLMTLIWGFVFVVLARAAGMGD